VTHAPGCFTTARATGGVVWHARRHVRRLVRDANLMGLGTLDADACLRELAALAARTADGSTTIVRLEVRRSGGALRFHGSTRDWGDDPPAWRAAIAPVVHPGATPVSQVKSTERGLYAHARAAAEAQSAQEALLFDHLGFLVEGARTNVVALRADGALVTPPLARGCVAGVAREVLFDAIAELQEGDVEIGDLVAVRELVAVNAVRGARAITHEGERAIGRGEPGPWCARLAQAFEESAAAG
jgi:branched-chain amino acid aminotransferase